MEKKISSVFVHRLQMLTMAYNQLIGKANSKKESSNGIFSRYEHPVLTTGHVPMEWRYDFNEQSNPYFMERIMVNTVFNSGAIKWKGKYILIARIEGVDRKSFFAIAESPNGIDNFVFRKTPLYIPQLERPDTNVYDMRLTLHEDGWVYGLFCTERRDGTVPEADQSAAIAQCGIVRTRDLENWERLPDLKTRSLQQRNVVLHPEFVSGKYGFYTRPQDGFIEAGKGGGIAFGLAAHMENAVVTQETIVHPKMYHTVYEAKNGDGPTPIKTREGWLHLAHGVRNTAAGLRYVLYLLVTDLNDLTKVIYNPAGYLLAPVDDERTGDVSNVLFCNGWIADDDGTIYIYYASSDSRMHVATTTLSQLLDYAKNTLPDGYNSASSVAKIMDLIKKNESSETAWLVNSRV